MNNLTEKMQTRIHGPDEDFDIYLSKNKPQKKSHYLHSCFRKFLNCISAGTAYIASFKRIPRTKRDIRAADLEQLYSHEATGYSSKLKAALHVVASIKLPVVWILGGPGAPIEPMISQISRKIGFRYILVGEMLENELQLDSGHEELARKLLERGVLIPRRFLMEMIIHEMAKSIQAAQQKACNGFLFSDFPSSFEQSVTFQDKVGPVDYIVVLRFDVNTMHLNAYNMLKQQSVASKRICKSKEQLKNEAENLVDGYNKELKQLYKRHGQKVRIIDAELPVLEICRIIKKWAERAMIIHDIPPPPSLIKSSEVRFNKDEGRGRGDT